MKNFVINITIILFLSSNIYSQWFQQNSGTSANLGSVFFIDANIGWTCGTDGKIIKTTNGGFDWLEQNSNTTVGLNTIQFIDAGNGWACGSNQILKTTDGGLVWSVQNFPSSTNLYAIQFVDTNIGWITSHFADSAYIQKSTDGGVTWTIQHQAQNEYYESIHFLDENIGWVTFSAGLSGVLKTTDGGNIWTQYNANISGSPMDIWFVNNLIGWTSHNTLGSYGISKSTDGGVTWFSQIQESGKFIHSINFPNSNIGYAVGWQMYIPPNPDQEFIMKTTDGGSSWYEQYRDVGVLNSIFFVNDTLGWAVGNDGEILTTKNGGVTSVEEENSSITPNDFFLFQNYPNPFNPSTTISYSIPEIEFVTLKIYNVLGSEVATLVNEEKPAGSYGVEFFKANLSSGIYFYRIQAGNFTSTKKMVLMK